jgi:excisionase family DNA binding protein
MADRVLIPLQSVGVLALTREDFETALAAGTNLTGSQGGSPNVDSPEAVLDPDQVAARLGVSTRWLEDSARAGIVPHYKLGRFIRFRVSEVANHCRVAGAAIPTGNEERANGIRRAY